MTTGMDAANAIPFATKDPDKNLLAVNFALSASWHKFKLEEQQKGGTLASGTPEYTLSITPAPSMRLGIAEVLIDESAGEAKVIHRGIRQWYDGSAGKWVLVFSPSLVSGYAGKDFYVHYQYRHPTLTTLLETIHDDLPLDYLGQAGALYYAWLYASAQTEASDFVKAMAPEYLRAGKLPSLPFVHQLPERVGYGKERLP